MFMNKYVVRMTIITEGGNSFSFYENIIGILDVSNITKNIYRCASNTATLNEYAESVFFELFPYDNIEKFEALTQYNDIVAIGFLFSDGSYEEYLIKWSKWFTEENADQTYFVSENKHLYISIGNISAEEMVELNHYLEDEMLREDLIYHSRSKDED